MTAPLGIAFPAAGARFHLVAEGRAFLRRAGDDPRPLDTGDVVLLPAGGARGLSDARVDRSCRTSRCRSGQSPTGSSPSIRAAAAPAR